MHFLLIDDDPLISMLNKKMISNINSRAEFTVCDNGEEAIEIIKERIVNGAKLPDVIFLDINMPVADGWDFLSEYEKLNELTSQKVMIYMLSSSISPRDVSRAFKSNIVVDYLAKPVNKVTMESLISSWH